MCKRDNKEEFSTEEFGQEQTECERPCTASRKEQLDNRFNKIDFACKKSIRYLTKRRMFFDNLHCLTMSMSSIASSAAFVSLFSPNLLLTKILVGIVAVATAFDFVMGFAERARAYDDLQARFAILLTKIVDVDFNAENLKEIEKERILIEKDEPTPLKVLDIICHNEEAESQGKNKHIYKIGWFRRKLRHIISFDSYKPVLENTL